MIVPPDALGVILKEVPAIASCTPRCSSLRVIATNESNLSHTSFEFIVDGKDLSNDYDFSEIDFKYGDDAESQYESDGEAEWYEISAVLSDGNEVEHDDGDSLDDWLREEGYLTDE